MKIHNLSAILTVCCTLALAGCGPADAPLAPAPGAAAAKRPIINGKKCDASTHPASMAIIMEGKLSAMGMTIPMRTVLCTGTLIAPDVVLSAAHCVDPTLITGGQGTISELKIYVSFTSDLTDLVMDINKIITGQLGKLPADAIEVKSYIANPGFSAALLAQFQGGLINLYDISLLFLGKTVDKVTPAVVVTKDEKPQVKKGAKVRISGWGQQSAAPQNPFFPPPAGSVGVKVCAESHINELGTHEMQIGSDAASSRKCHGDSGGPSYMTVQTTGKIKERVVGITSHAYDKTDCQKGGVDTRVDAWLDWMEQEMKKACDSGLRVWCKVKGIIPPSYYDQAPDMGVPDTGAATSDGAPTQADGSAAADGSAPTADSGATDPGDEESGCDCGVGRTPQGAGATLPLLALAALLLVLRRRQE